MKTHQGNGAATPRSGRRPRTSERGAAGRRAALATYARRRAEKAIAELDSQGYTVITPDGVVVCGQVVALAC